MDLFEKSPNPTWIFDSETLRFLDVNQAAIDLYGWSREEFLKMSILDIRPPEDIEAVIAHVKLGGTQHPSGPVATSPQRRIGTLRPHLFLRIAIRFTPCPRRYRQ